MKRRSLLTAAASVCFVAIPVAAASRSGEFTTAQRARIDRLLQLIQQRLEMAPALAETRWRTMSRIEDAPSEQLVMEAVRVRAAKLALDPELTTRFAQAQIDAAKIIQTAQHRVWAANMNAAPERDTTANVFKASTPEPEFTVGMLKALHEAAGVLRRRGGRRLLDARAADLIHVDLLAGQAALQPLYEIAN